MEMQPTLSGSSPWRVSMCSPSRRWLVCSILVSGDLRGPDLGKGEQQAYWPDSHEGPRPPDPRTCMVLRCHGFTTRIYTAYGLSDQLWVIMVSKYNSNTWLPTLWMVRMLSMLQFAVRSLCCRMSSFKEIGRIIWCHLSTLDGRHLIGPEQTTLGTTSIR